MTKNNTNNWIKFTKITLILWLVFANLSLALAQGTSTTTPAPAATTSTTPASTTTGSYHSFPLKYLNFNDNDQSGKVKGTQGQSYFTNSSGQVSSNPLASFILQVINFITVTAGSLAFFGIVVGGFLMIVSAGNDNQVTKGKDIITRSVVGLAITLCAYFIVAFVQSLLFETAAK